MTSAQIFNKLFYGGNITLPYLIKFTHGNTEIRLINDNKSVVYDGESYNISSFDYNPPDNNGKGGSLSITSDDDNSLFEFIENADETWQLDVIGTLREDNTVQQLHIYKHMYGSVSIDENNAIEFSLEGDDRTEMQFCVYSFDTDNNRAGA